MKPTLALAFVFGSICLSFAQQQNVPAPNGPSPTAPTQVPRVSAPHKPIDPRVPKSLEAPASKDTPVPRSMVGGFWMTDANRNAAIYLKNGLEELPISVTPLLYLSNGARYQLSPVTLEPSGTAVISINEALQQHGIASWATLSGYVEIGYTWAWDPICVTVTTSDPIHSTIFTSGFQPSLVSDPRFNISKPKVSNMFLTDGMWWKAEAAVTGFVALSNVTGEPIDAHVQVSDGSDNEMATYSMRISAHGTKIVSLEALQHAAVGSAGGLRVFHTGSEQGLLIDGGLEDDATGYSANIPFHYRFNASPTSGVPETYAELGLMTGAADPMMSFPSGTQFRPFSVARNVSRQPITLTPSIYWMQAGKAQFARLGPMTLLPLETRELDLAALLASAGLRDFNGSFNLILETSGESRSLILASGSVDQRNTYVFQVLPRGVQDSEGKAISYWSTGKGDDTMVTVWNPADEIQEYRFTLSYAGGHYVIPIRLEARATRTFNISSIIENQIPDDEGNTIPSGVREGSAKISGIHADNEEILVAMDAGTYNVRKATCSYYCISCDGEVLTYVVVTPYSLAKNQTSQLNFQVKTNTGSMYYISGTWSSNKTTAITVGASNGVATGVGGGKATISTYTNSTAVYNSYYCYYDPFCPYNGYASGTGPVSGFTVTSVTPYNLTLGGSGILTIYGTGFTTLFTPTATFPTGSGITTGTPSVVSDTQMNVSYQVTCGAVIGATTLLIGDSVDGGISGVSWGENVVLPSAPAATLKLAGNSISGTQSVVVGAQIALTASVSLPTCMSISSQQWSVPGTTVGGFNTGTTGGPVATNFTKAANTFYWTDSGSSRNVTYQYTMSGGGASVTSPTATATFNVAAPTASVTSGTGTVEIVGNTSIGFDSSSDIGIDFNASLVPPSGYSGTIEWEQLITGFSAVYKSPTVTTTCSFPTNGSDGAFPYGTQNPANDSPTDALADPKGNPNTETIVSGGFKMFLMWKPSGVASPIAVPLGSVSWNWNGDATLNTTTKKWSLKSGSSISANSFVHSTTYPSWQKVLTGSDVTCK